MDLNEDLAIKMLRSWKPNDDLERLKLGSPEAPHEVPAVLRMTRAGHDGARVRSILGYTRTNRLINEMTRARTKEWEAKDRGLPIHDAPIVVRLPEGDK